MKYDLKALTNEDGRTQLQYPTSWTVLKRSEKTILHQKHFKRLWIVIEAMKLESDFFAIFIWTLNMSSHRHISKVLNFVNPRKGYNVVANIL